MAPHEAVEKAAKSYALNARDWKFLGYSEALAVAILTEFFSMPKVRNPSPKPLNVLAMVGKSRVVALRERVEATQSANTAPKSEEAATDDAPDEAR